MAQAQCTAGAGRFFNGKKKLECPVVSQICTLWPLRFHQEFFFFSLMQPVCPDISFAHFDDCCFTSNCFLYVCCNPCVQMVTLQPPLVTHQPPLITLQSPRVTRQPPSLTRQPPSVTLHAFLAEKKNSSTKK